MFDAVGSIASNGTVAITHDTAIRVLGNPGVHVEPRQSHPALWNPEGTMLAYGLIDYRDPCTHGRDGLGVVAVPGGKPRVLIPPSAREIGNHQWSPDGRTIAVDLGPRGAGGGRAAREATRVAEADRPRLRDVQRTRERGDAAAGAARGAGIAAAPGAKRRSAACGSITPGSTIATTRPATRRCATRSQRSSTSGSTPPAGNASRRSTRSRVEVVRRQLARVRTRPVRFAAPAREPNASASSIS